MIACIDIGGTFVRVGVSEDRKTFLDIKKFSTPQQFSDLINKIAESLMSYSAEVEQFSIAAAGVIDREKSALAWWGHRQNWKGESFSGWLGKKFPNAKFVIENDASMATLGEAAFGAGRDYKTVGFITLSTGIGGGLVVERKIVESHVGFEPGHQIINFKETEIWNCGQYGCFESYASGSAFRKIFGVAGEDCHDQAIWKEYGSVYLAPGIANVTALWSPEVIILGGGVSNQFDYFIGSLNEELKKIIPFDLPKIAKSELGEAGLYGGLALV